jgi:hypothetical protein
LMPAAARGDSVLIELQSAGPRGAQRHYEICSEGLADDRGHVRGGIITFAPRRRTKS